MLGIYGGPHEANVALEMGICNKILKWQRRRAAGFQGI